MSTGQELPPTTVSISPSGKIINNGDDGLTPVTTVRRKSKTRKSSSRKIISSSRRNVSDKSDTETDISEASVTSKTKVDKLSTSKRSKTVTSATKTTKNSVSKSTVKTSPSSNLPIKVPSQSTPSQAGSTGSKLSKKLSKSPVVKHSKVKTLSRSVSKTKGSSAVSKGRHRVRKSKSKAGKTSTTTSDDSKKKRSGVEPAFFTTISPEFFTRLKEMANESTTYNIKSSTSSRRDDQKKTEPIKLETLSKLDEINKENFRRLKKGKGHPGISFNEARDALSLGHVPESLFNKDSKVKSTNIGKKEGDKEISTSLKNSIISDTSGMGIASSSITQKNSSLASNKSHLNNNKSILCHGPACNISHLSIKKQLRFADHNSDGKTPINEPTTTSSCSNNTRMRPGNLLGGKKGP